jgi:replicative DNA helicase
MDQFMRKYPHIKIIDRIYTIEQIERICKKEKALYGLDTIVVDYIQRTADKEELVPRTQKVSKGIKQICINEKCAGIALSQFNRIGAKAGMPTSNDILGGESIKQDADAVWILHNETLANDMHPVYDPGYILKKTHDRNGEKGDIYLRRERGSMNFKECDNPPTWL